MVIPKLNTKIWSDNEWIRYVLFLIWIWMPILIGECIKKNKQTIPEITFFKYLLLN